MFVTHASHSHIKAFQGVLTLLGPLALLTLPIWLLLRKAGDALQEEDLHTMVATSRALARAVLQQDFPTISFFAGQQSTNATAPSGIPGLSLPLENACGRYQAGFPSQHSPSCQRHLQETPAHLALPGPLSLRAPLAVAEDSCADSLTGGFCTGHQSCLCVLHHATHRPQPLRGTCCKGNGAQLHSLLCSSWPGRGRQGSGWPLQGPKASESKQADCSTALVHTAHVLGSMQPALVEGLQTLISCPCPSCRKVIHNLPLCQALLHLQQHWTAAAMPRAASLQPVCLHVGKA